LRGAPGVTACAVTVASGSLDGPRLLAYVVLDKGASHDVDGVRQWLRQRLPAYLIPDVIVPIEALPQTPSGKLDVAKLPVPGTERAVAYEAPASDLEHRIATIWEELLERDQVGRYDNFFDIGGHSLLQLLPDRGNPVFQVARWCLVRDGAFSAWHGQLGYVELARRCLRQRLDGHDHIGNQIGWQSLPQPLADAVHVVRCALVEHHIREQSRAVERSAGDGHGAGRHTWSPAQ
ncbi:MAG: hypothetical protein AAFN13_18895, partial [Bacteroidota bacterium]